MTTPMKSIVFECHLCTGDTEHEILFSHKKEGKSAQDHDYEYQQSGRWSVVSEVLKCLGCRELTIRRTAEDSEAPEPNVDLFPPRRREKRTLPNWVKFLPPGIYSLFKEIYSAIQTDSYRLAAMGLRALMDELMTNTLGDIGGFELKVNKMVSEGYLSKVQKGVLDPTLELGHAATHRSHQPSGSQLDAALGIVEGMLHLFYVQSKVVANLKAGVEPRKKVKGDKKAQSKSIRRTDSN